HVRRAHLETDGFVARRGPVAASIDPPRAGPELVLHGEHPAPQDGVPADARHLFPLRGPVSGAGARYAARPDHRQSVDRRRHTRGAKQRNRVPQRLPVLLQAAARDRVLLRIWGVAHRARPVQLPRPVTDQGWLFPESQLPLSDVKTLVVWCLVVSTVLFAVGATGHVWYGAYLLAPLWAGLYRPRNDAWAALIISLVAFTLVTALARAAGHGWAWWIYTQESLVLVLAGAAVVVLLGRVVGDYSDKLGSLEASLDQTNTAIAELIREIGSQGQALATMAAELATAAQQLQSSSQAISTTTVQLTEGTERQRQLIGYGRQDSEAASGLASTLHSRAQLAERQITEIAQQAHKRGEE